MSQYLPGYEVHPVLGCTGPGSYVNGYPWRIVLHTTESPFGSGPGIINFFSQNPCSCPHFMLDPGTKQKVQFIPIDYSAAALRGGQGGYETNRGHAIQVEICGKADEAASWSDSVLKFIGGWIADVVNAGYPINLNNVTGSDYRGTVATASSPYRMSWQNWQRFDGVCGHIDVPGNDHYDPYHLDKTRVVAHAKQHLGQPQEEDDVTVEELQRELVNQDTRFNARLSQLEAKINAILINVDPVGVAAGAPGNGPAYLRTDVEAIKGKVGA